MPYKFARPQLGCRIAECEGHRAFDDALPVDTRDAFQQSHAASKAKHDGLDFHGITRVNRTAVTHALNAGEKRQALTVFRLRENQDRPYLGDRFGENRRRQHRYSVRIDRQVAFVQRHILDADDSLIELEFGDAIDQQERITMRENPFDRLIVERQSQIHEPDRLYFGNSTVRLEPDTTSILSIG